MTTAPIAVRGDVDPRAVEQLRRCAAAGDAVAAAICADGHVGYCVPLDTEILTKRGWLRHDQVEVGDETIALHPRTGLSVWSPITAIHHGHDEVLRLAHSRWSARVTPKHRWWTDRRIWGDRSCRSAPALVETDAINAEHRLILAAPFAGGDLPVSPEEAAILGWLLCDGYISKQDEHGRQSPIPAEASAFISQAKPHGRQALEALLADVPHPVGVRDRPNTTWPSARYRLTSTYIRALWTRAGLDRTGYHDMVLGLTRDALDAFLDAVIRAEGTDSTGSTLIAQNPGELHDAIALAVYLSGAHPRLLVGQNRCRNIGVGKRFPWGAFLEREPLGEEPVWCVSTELGSWTMKQDDRIMLTGNSQPIGGVVAYRDHVSPSGVGYDIGCGNKAVCTDVRVADLRDDVARVMDEIVDRISFGVGRKNDEPVDHPVLDQIRDAPFEPQRALLDTAAEQLGTVGAGNHYVDLFAGDDGYVWVGVHFGSRGFGHKTASGFLRLAAGLPFDDRKEPKGEMDSPPVLLPIDEGLGQSYIEAMNLAGAYAYAGRDVVVEKVLQILGTKSTFEVHNHHNFAWLEQHHGETVWVIRKGCTPAFPGQQGFVGSTMGEDSVILTGSAHDGEKTGLLYSTVHGAGRVMSRTAAAGKSRKRWSCSNRDCDWVQQPGEPSPMVVAGKTKGAAVTAASGVCPRCGHGKLTKRWVQERPGLVDWDAARSELARRGVILKGGAADEAPQAYKRLDEVLAAHADTIELAHRLTPIGVAMATADTYDPFKD